MTMILWDTVVAISFFMACAPLREQVRIRFLEPVVKSEEACRAQLFKCYYDDDNDYVSCIRSWNSGENNAESK